MSSREAVPALAASWTKKDVDDDTAYSVKTSKVFRGYTENQLKSVCKGMQRLTLKATQGLHEITMPCLMDPGKEQSVFLFRRLDTYPAEDEGVDVEISCSKTIKLVEKALHSSANMYESHAFTVFDDLCNSGTNFVGCVKAMMGP